MLANTHILAQTELCLSLFTHAVWLFGADFPVWANCISNRLMLHGNFPKKEGVDEAGLACATLGNSTMFMCQSDLAHDSGQLLDAG